MYDGGVLEGGGKVVEGESRRALKERSTVFYPLDPFPPLHQILPRAYMSPKLRPEHPPGVIGWRVDPRLDVREKHIA